MISENYVSSKIAELFREKGFNEECWEYYDDNGNFKHFRVTKCNYDNLPYKNAYIAPTYQIVLKWLREVHNLHIDIFIGIAEDDSYTYWTYFITDLKGNMIVNAYGEDIDFKGENYEQTIESAIENCLTNLI